VYPSPAFVRALGLLDEGIDLMDEDRHPQAIEALSRAEAALHQLALQGPGRAHAGSMVDGALGHLAERHPVKPEGLQGYEIDSPRGRVRRPGLMAAR
jgi:hypothetical protein